MEYPKNELAQLVIEYCITYKIEEIVISPGSRNAPLTIGFTNNPKFKPYSIVDERCAAFFALGIAQQTRKPVALVCTSGSALLNYYPAIAEAFYSNIPLIVLSADRPKHLVDVGDGQTIRQENVFINHSEFNANLDNSLSLKENTTFLNEALHTCISRKGPVHINIPFDEPLYETVNKPTIKAVELSSVANVSRKENLKMFAEIWNNSSKKMVLVGECFPNDRIQEQLKELTEDNSVLVLTETTSNLHHHKFISNIDNLIFPLSEKEKVQLQPDILVTFGGMVISKRIKKILRNHSPKHHWHIDLKRASDTYHCLSHYFEMKVESFFNEFSPQIVRTKSDYQEKWLQVKIHRERGHSNFIFSTEYSDLKVFDIIIKSLPKSCLLQSGNSSIIRYLQLFEMNKNVDTFCNRGTSGIDGSTSTAIGASLMNEKQTIFITGDISFFYDSNALWNNYIRSDFRIILINNAGGGIFRIISGPTDTNAANYFETTHKLNASSLCKMFDVEYVFAKSEIELKNQLGDFYNESKKPKLLEVFTPKEINDSILKDYFKYLV